MLICSRLMLFKFLTIVHNSSAVYPKIILWNNRHISNLYKQIYFTFYTKNIASPNTDNANMKLLLHASVQIQRKSLIYKNHTTTHPTPQAWCRQPVRWKPSSLRVQHLGQWGPRRFVSEQLQSQSVWGTVSCQFWLARVGLGEWRQTHHTTYLPADIPFRAFWEVWTEEPTTVLMAVGWPDEPVSGLPSPFRMPVHFQLSM